MSFYTLNISTIQDTKNLTVFNDDIETFGISNALLNGEGDTIPSNFWYPTQIPSNSLYTIYFSTGAVNPTNFRLWANNNIAPAENFLPSTIQLTVGGLSTFVDQNPVWLPYYLPFDPFDQKGYVYENSVGTGTLSNVSNFGLSFNYYDEGTDNPTDYGINLYNLKIQGTSYIPPPPPEPIYPKEELSKSCGCGPKSTGPGAILESMYLEKKVKNCTVINSTMARQLVNSQLRGVPSSVRTQKVQQNTLECYAPITDPIRRQALYQGPVISPPCPPTPAEQLNSTRPKVSEAGACLQQVPFYQRPSK